MEKPSTERVPADTERSRANSSVADKMWSLAVASTLADQARRKPSTGQASQEV